LSNKSKFLESGLNGGVTLLEGSSAIQVKSGLENQNVMPLKGHEFCDKWCNDNHALLNYVHANLLIFFTLFTIFVNVGTENFHKNYAVTLSFVKTGAVGAPLCLGK